MADTRLQKQIEDLGSHYTEQALHVEVLDVEIAQLRARNRDLEAQLQQLREVLDPQGSDGLVETARKLKAAPHQEGG
jgi:phage shock protein A